MPDQLFELLSQPGVRRDGATADSPFYSDGTWVRWQRGKPRKMGGYRSMSTQALGPVRSILVDSRNGVNTAHTFSPWGIQRTVFGKNGAAGDLVERTPLTFTPDSRLHWSHGILSSSLGGSESSLIATSTPDLNQIDSDEPGRVWAGSMLNDAPLSQLFDSKGQLLISGGVAILHPFVFLYGSNGLIRNSNANDYSAATGWTAGGGNFANQANVSGTKFVHGAPVRGGGQSPAGLFWSLDSLVRVSFVGGTAIWSYDTVAQTSVLAKKAIVEHDGRFFWPGVDRFLSYNGVVQEMPNQMNSNWFFDNLNQDQRNKVWGTKIARWGEIWWFFPKGQSEECDHAVIWNYLENTWYDAKKERSAGGQVQNFASPIWAGDEDTVETTVLTVGLRRLTTGVTPVNTNRIPTDIAGLYVGMTLENPGVQAGTVIQAFDNGVAILNRPVNAAIPAGAVVIFSSMLRPFLPGQEVRAKLSGALGRVSRATFEKLNIVDVVGTFAVNDELIGDATQSAKILAPVFNQRVSTLYQHEVGLNKIVGDKETALLSSFTSKDFGFSIGQPFADATTTADVNTIVNRIAPDFSQQGDLTVEILGRAFPNRPLRTLATQTLGSDSPFEDIRDAQERILRVKITTNTLNGNFDQGKVMLSLSVGDERSGEVT